MSHKITMEISDESYDEFIARKTELSVMMNRKITNGEALVGIMAYLDGVIERLNELNP